MNRRKKEKERNRKKELRSQLSGNATHTTKSSVSQTRFLTDNTSISTSCYGGTEPKPGSSQDFTDQQQSPEVLNVFPVPEGYTIPRLHKDLSLSQKDGSEPSASTVAPAFRPCPGTANARQDKAGYLKEYMRRKRTLSSLRKRENERAALQKRYDRTDPTYKQREAERETSSRKRKRSASHYKEKEKIRETSGRKRQRTNPDFREKEKVRDRSDRKSHRTNPDYKKKEQVRETRGRKSQRTNPDYKEKEQVRETRGRKSQRTNPDYKEKEQVRETRGRKSQRTNPDYREKEKVRDRSDRKRKRQNPEYHREEKQRETARRSAVREEQRPSDIETTIAQFHQFVQHGPTYICTSCNQLWYKHSVVKLTSSFSNSQELSQKVNDILHICPRTTSMGEDIWICRTCQSYIKKGKIPPSSVMNKMLFPEQGPLKDLNPLEQTLLAARLPFMKIHQAPRGKQKFIQGNMVLVPADVSSTVNQLPRLTSDTATIKATLKRRLRYKHHVYCLNIRPEVLLEAAQFLSSSPLYKEHDISFITDWTCTAGESELPSKSTAEHDSQQFTESFQSDHAQLADVAREPTTPEVHVSDSDTVVQPADTHQDLQATVKQNTVELNSDNAQNDDYDHHQDNPEGDEDDDKWSEIDSDELVYGQADTLLTSPDFIEPEEREQVYNFAPGEGNVPVSVFMEKDAEELAFPGIFCGIKRPANTQRQVKVTYGEIVKAELRNADRRAANSVENLFFKTKKIQMKTLIDQTQIALRKVKMKNSRLTAKDVRGQAALDLIHHDKAYKFLSNIRGSPPYFEKVSKDLFAFIRHLGPATYFLTLSAAETRWTHLLRILAKVVDNRELSDEEISHLSWPEKCRLIQSDPITCARHFDFAVQKFISQFLLSKVHPLSTVSDYFYRVEYQQRGSPHVHMIIWCQDAPKYGEDTEESICAFIDKYITCAKLKEEQVNSELVQLQKHRHSHTCRKKGKKKCRFGFPKPPMLKTCILEPLQPPEHSDDDIKAHQKTWTKISQQLNSIDDQDDNVTLEGILLELNLSEAEYILSIRASLKSATIFLKRSPQEVRINNYNAAVLEAWRANIDIQFVLDCYACATYVASYVTKSQRGMSELLRTATEEAAKGNQTLKEQVRLVGNKFLNAVELSAQEAAYICLQLPMKKASRQCVFVNTSPPEERVTLLKPAKCLEALGDEEEDIECSSQLTRYADRPHTMENVPLAEFCACFSESNTVKPTPRANLLVKKTIDNLLPEPTGTVNEDAENESDEEVERATGETDKNLTQTDQYRRRKVPRILRSVHFNPDKDSEKYYRELIMLYVPWRDEHDLMGGHETFYSRFKELENEVLAVREKFEPFSDTVDTAQEMLNNNTDMLDAWDELAPGTEHASDMDRASVPPQKEVGIEDSDLALDFGLPVTNVEEELSKYYELPDEQYRQNMRSLNQEQREFVYNTLHQIKTSAEPVYTFLSGGAGVGKSFVVKALYQTVLKFLNKKAGQDFTARNILLVAPTGKAAYHIRGNTVHSAFKIPPNQSLSHKPLSSSSLNTLRNQLGDLKLIFIDEISMVGFRMFNFIHQRLMEVTQSKQPFGGISVIAVGDLFQLPPVRDSYIFSAPKSGYMALATNLWQDIFCMCELKTIMRQADNLPFAELLNRLREGLQTPADIAVLKQRVVSEGDADTPKDACRVFATNDAVNAYNSEVIRKSSNTVYSLKAKDRVLGSTAPGMKAKILETFRTSKQHTSQQPNTLEVAVGIYYDLTVNVDTTDGLVNGASCKIMEIDVLDTDSYASGTLWVQFDDLDTAAKMRVDNKRLYKPRHVKTWTPLQPILKQYAAGYKGQAQVQRYQFPLRPSHAKTIHRSQGDTLDKAVVDLTTRRKVDHMHYVALSRVQTLDGLSITNLQEDKISVDKQVVKEMDRLRSLPPRKPLKFLYEDQNSCKATFLNACSLHRHFSDVQSDFNIKAADIVCFCETRLCVRDSRDDTSLAGFYQYRQDEVGTNRRSPYGLAVYSKYPFIEPMPVNESKDGIELCVFRVACSIPTSFVVVYKHPKPSVGTLCKVLTTLHHNHKYLQDSEVVIMGDFNVDWSSDSSDKQTLQSLLVDKLHYKQVIKGPTNDHGSTIDLIFTRLDVDTESGVMETYFSDHKLIWTAWHLD